MNTTINASVKISCTLSAPNLKKLTFYFTLPSFFYSQRCIYQFSLFVNNFFGKP